MKCLNCSYKNSYKSKYCYNCGKYFSKEERIKESDKGIVKFLRKTRKIYDTLTLSTITGNKYFRIFSILFIILFGLGGIIINGIHLKIMESDNYTYQYNKIEKEYYIYTKENETLLNLYSLGAQEKIELNYYNEENELLTQNTFDNFNNVKIKTNSISNNYYIINYKNDTLKLYVYKI